MLGPVLDVLFPRVCAGCRSGEWPFCDSCRAGLVALEPPWCRRCGLPSGVYAPACRGCPPAEVDAARSAFLFVGPARAAVHRLKFSGWRSVGEALAEAMVRAASDVVARGDAVAWVPLSRRRRAERGFDQAEILARGVGRRVGLPTRALVARVAETPPQAHRAGAERRAAMAGAFRAAGPPPRRVLLIDDVLTTGATAAGCAAALRDAGAEEVVLLTAARAAPGSLPRGYTRAGSRSGLWLPGEEAPR